MSLILCAIPLLFTACNNSSGGGKGSSDDGHNISSSDSFSDSSTSESTVYAPTSLKGKAITATSSDRSEVWVYVFDSDYTYSNTKDGISGSGYLGAYTYKRLSDTKAEIEIHGTLRSGMTGSEKGTITLNFSSNRSGQGVIDRTLNGLYIMKTIQMSFVVND